jgi:CcmD family protein
MNDLQTFTLAFAVVWLGMGAYLLRLHRLASRLARRLDGTDMKRSRP